MHQIINLTQYLGPHAADPALTDAIKHDAVLLISAWNSLCLAAEKDGVRLIDDPDTGTAISGAKGGTGGGGWRPNGTTAHGTGNALDRFDPEQKLMRWILMHRTLLDDLGMFFEHPQWTSVWVHGQRVPPHSGIRFFVPYADLQANPPTCPALPEQPKASVRVFPFGGK